MLAGLVVLGVFAIWYSLVFVRGWEGAALGVLGFHVICGAVAGYLIEKVIRHIQEKIRAAAALMMSNFSQGGRNFLSEGEIHITLK